MIFEAIGTKWEIVIDEEINQQNEKELFEEILLRIDMFGKNYSRFRSDSLVTKMSKEAGKYKLPVDAKKIFDAYFRIYNLTNGSVTPLIGKLMEETGYDSKYSFVPKELNRPPKWQNAMTYDFPNLEIKIPVLIDIGAGGKGYLIDIVGEIIENYGVKSFLINAGGDILYRNERNNNLKVGLEDPENTQNAIGIATISNQSICGSAGNRRKWDKFHHILDPYKLESTKGILATWTVAETTMDADLVSTALFFEKADKLLKDLKFEYLILFEDRSIEQSEYFPIYEIYR